MRIFFHKQQSTFFKPMRSFNDSQHLFVRYACVYRLHRLLMPGHQQSNNAFMLTSQPIDRNDARLKFALSGAPTTLRFSPPHTVPFSPMRRYMCFSIASVSVVWALLSTQLSMYVLSQSVDSSGGDDS